MEELELEVQELEMMGKMMTMQMQESSLKKSFMFSNLYNSIRFSNGIIDPEIYRRGMEEIRPFLETLENRFKGGGQVLSSVHNYLIRSLIDGSVKHHNFGPKHLNSIYNRLMDSCRVVCIGDSNTSFWIQDRHLVYGRDTYPLSLGRIFFQQSFNTNIMAYGEPGVKIDEMTESLKSSVLKINKTTESFNSPRIALVSLGVNDVGSYAEEGNVTYDELKKNILGGLEKLCSYVPGNFSKDASIYITSIPIVHSEYFQDGKVSRADIDTINSNIKGLCKTKNYGYISIEDGLTDEDFSDWIHFNGQGMKKVADNIFKEIRNDLEKIQLHNKYKI